MEQEHSVVELHGKKNDSSGVLEEYAITSNMKSSIGSFHISSQIIQKECKTEAAILNSFLEQNIAWSKSALTYMTDDNSFNLEKAIDTPDLDRFYERFKRGDTFTKDGFMLKLEQVKKSITKWKLSIILLSGDWLNNMLPTADSQYAVSLTELSTRLNNLHSAKQFVSLHNQQMTQLHSIASHKFSKIRGDGDGGFSKLSLAEYLYTTREICSMQQRIEETSMIGAKKIWIVRGRDRFDESCNINNLII